MTWFKVDDSFYDHPKAFDLPDSAVALWTRAGSWAARNRTDGFVPSGMTARFCNDHIAAIRALVDRGLWKRTRGGYRFHDWRDYQPSKEEATAAQAKKSSGGKLGNHRRWHAGRGVQDPECPYCQRKQPSDNRSESDRTTEGDTESGANPPVPSRPGPSMAGLSNQPADRNARDPDDHETETIIKEVLAVTGRTIDAEWARLVRGHILTGRSPADPIAYMRQAIRNEPNPRLRFLPQY